MTRHGPTVLVSDEFGPLISIGGVMTGPVAKPLSAEEEAKFRENLDAIDALLPDDDYSLQWSNYTCRRLLATLDQARLIEGSDPASPEPRTDWEGLARALAAQTVATPVAGSTTTQPDPTIRERLRELAAKATPGGWDAPIQVEHGDYGSVLSRWIEAVEAADGRPVCMFHDDYGHDSWADATYIAAANPETIRALLDELDTLERRVRAAEGALTVIRGDIGWLATVKCDCDPAWTERGRHQPLNGCLFDELRLDSETIRSLISGTKEPTDG